MTLNGTYNGTPTVGNACTKCTTNEYCEGGTANKKIKCEAGYYLPANSTTCTICPAGSYCPGNEEFDPTASTSDRGIYSCPAASGSYLDTYTDMQTWVNSACSDSTSSNTTIIKAAITSWDSKKGKSEITGCGVDYTLNTPCGTLIKENVPYNTSTGKYDTYVNSAEVGYHYYSALAVGYYLDEQYSTTYCNTSTNRMLYKTAHKCPGGGLYCPGFTGSTLPLCNNTAWTYGEPVGMYGCGTGAASTGDGDGNDYWSSATGADARTDCYVRVNLYKNGGTGSITGDSTATGTTSGVKTCYYNTACTLPSASGLTQTGYKFSGGWGTTSSATSCSNSITLTSAKVASTNYYACKNPTYSITLNENNGGSSTGTSTLYTTKTVGVYLDSSRTQSLTTAGTYKVTMPTWAPEYYYSESEYPVIFDARPALGYYSSSDGGTQYVDADGVITSSGLTAAKGYGANATWHAQYDTMVTAPDAPANKVGYTFTGWCLDNSEDCAGGMTVAAGEEFDLNDFDGDLTAMWAPHTTIRITYNGENDADGADYIYAIEGVDGVYLDAAHTKRMTTTTNPITYPDLYTWDVSFTDSYTGTNITRSGIDADPDGVYDSNGTEMIDSRGYITTAGIAAAKAVAYDGSGYNASWGMSWTWRPGTCVTVPDAPTRTGYTFDGWVTDQDDVFQPGDEYCSHEYSDTSLTAEWTANKYTITLDNASATTNGTASIYTTYNTNVYLDSSRSKAMTTSANAITVPSRTGYTFGGYYSASGGTGTQYINASGYITSSGLSAGKGYTASKTWYVKWTPNTYTITLNGNGATSNGTTAIYYKTDEYVYLDSSATKVMTTSANPITVPSRSYTITYNANGGSVSTTSQTAAYTFRGYFPTNAIEGDLPYIGTDGYIYDQGSAENMVIVPGNYTMNAWWSSKSVTLPTPSRTGYTFGGWYKESTLTNKVGDAGASYTPTATVTLYAKWTANKYTITLDNANATTNGTASIYTIYNTNVYLDSSRSKAMTTSANAITKPSRVYTVTYNANSGSVSPTSATSTYTFKGYYSAASDGTGTQYINASGNITSDGLTAGKGYTTNKTWYTQWTGAAVTLPTPSRTGYTFGGWYSNSSLTTKVGDAGASYTPTANVTLYAKWTPCTYTVTFKSGNTVLGTQSFTYGTAQNLTAVSSLSNIPVSSANGWYFSGWSTAPDDETEYDDNQSVSNLTAECGGNVTLYAVWTRFVNFHDHDDWYDRLQSYYNTSTTAAAGSAVETFALSAQDTWTPVGWVLNSTTSTTTASTATTTTAMITPPANVPAEYYALYKRTATVAYDGFVTTGGSTASTTGTQYYNVGDYETGGASSAIPLNVTLAQNGFSRTGYTFSKWAVDSSSGTQYAAGASYTFPNTAWDSDATATMVAVWTANTDTKYVVNHYTKNLGATTYTLNSTDNKTGTTATIITLANLKKTITGFTYSEGFAGTATKGTTKPTSGAVTTATILADGTRVIDLYYTRNTYTITVAAGNGISTVAASGWTNTGSANMTKSYEYGASIALATVVTPTQKTGYTGVAYTKTSGSGTLSGTSFTVGAGTATITAKATAISAPVVTLTPTSTTKVYNYQATTLTASNTTSYDSGITVYYKFGNATSSDGTYTYGDAGTTNTTSVAATSHRGTKYYKVQVYATDGTLTSSTTTSSAASVTLNNKTITFNVNGGTLSGTSPLYVSYNNASVYTGATNTTAGTVPTATKTGYTFNGWYTATSGGSQIYNASGTLTSAAVSGYTSGSKWVATADKTLYAQWTANKYTCEPGNYLNGTTCTQCTAGYYCPGNTEFTYNGGIQGRTACPAGTSAAGSDAATDCYFTVTLNKNSGTGTCGGASSTSNGSVTCYYNTTCTLPSWNSSTCNITNGTKIFKGWSESSTPTSGATSLTFTAAKTVYAYWVAPTCSVTNGTGSAASTTTNAPKCTVACNTGYKTSGTYTGTVGATSYSYTCSLETYTIAYTLNGGTNYSNAPTSYNVTTSTITLGTPTRSNSTFGGWYTESGFTNKVTQIAKGSTGNKTFYAKWTCNTGYTANSGNTACVANTITVAYNGNDNTGGSAPTSPTSCTYAGTCNAPSNTYIKTGKEFTGWNTKADGTGTSYAAGASISKAVSSGTLTLYAQWKDCTAGKYCPSDKVGAQACPAGTSAAGSDAATDCYFTVTLNKNSGTGTCGGASSTSNGSVTCYYNTACTLPSWNSSTCNITNGTGSAAKVFRGWGTSASATSWVSSVKLTAAATYYAGWTAPTCSATNGTATLSGVSGNAPVCTISCSSGYSQNGGTNTTASFDVTGAAGATSASGTCKARTFTVSFNVNGGSGGQSANVTATYDSAMPTISTTKPTKAGCKFNGWYDATSGGTQYYTAAGVSARTWNKTANTTLYAQWSCMSVTGPSNQSKVYDGAALTCNGGISVSAPSGASVTYATSSTGTYGAAPTITNVADSKTIYYKITATDYTDKTGSFTCSVTEATMTVSASDKTLTYNGTTTSNGTAQSCANVTVSVPSSGAEVKYNTDGSSTYSATAPTLTNTGSTTVYYQVTASNYTTKTGSYKCTMNSKAMTVSAGNKTKVYDGSALTCSVSVSVPSDGATIKYGTSSGSYTLTSAPTQTNVGSQTVYYQVTGSNFTTKTGSFTCSVTQADGSTTIKDGSTDVTNKSGSTAYPGTKSLTITCAGGATSNITATSGTTSVATTSVSGTSVTLTPKATGSSKITVNCPATTNYKASSATYDWTVTNGTISVSKSDKSKTYDGSALTCNGLTVSSPDDTTIEYSTDGGSTWSSTVPSRTDAGTTTVNYRVSKTYYTTATGSFSCKVNKAANPISVSSCGGEIAYPNSDTFTVSGAQGTLSVSSSATGVATVSISGTTGTVKSVKPGTATITVTAAGNDNYNAGSKTCSYEVVKGTNPISLSATSGSTAYPSTKSITVSNAAGTVTASSSATGVATVSVSSDGKTVTMTPKSAGSATITVTAAGDDYYNSGSKTYALTVNRGTCTISVSPTSGTIKIPTTTSTFTVNAGSCNGALSAVSSNTGVATVALSSETGTVTWQSAGTATITVTAAQTDQYAATTATYAVTTQKGDITATIAGNSKTYNGSALTCNGGISGLTPSDATIEYSTDNGSTWTTTAPTRTSAGTTTVKYRLSKTNYNNKEGSFSCKVNKAAGTTTIDAGASSSTAFPGTKTLNITCSESATISSATSGTTSVATVATSGNKVTLTPVKTGSSVITVNCPATTNYNASSATHTWTVTNGTITATVTNPSKTYNGSALSCAGISKVVPSGATVTYAEKSGTTCGTYSSTVPSRTNAGTTNVCYKIEATNYTTKTGEFSCTVNQADNTLTLSATSGSMPYSSTATFTVSTNTSGGTLSVESSNENCATATISGTTVTISSKANYCTANITVTSAATTNYKTKSATYALTVNKGTITLNNRSATSAGTTAIYQTYNTNVYLDSARSKAMTTSANAITVPSRTGYTFGGYYSASDGTGTQYINASGNITSDGLTAGKALQANGTWYAKWTANNYTITLDNANATTNGTASIYTTYNTNVYLDSSRSKAMTTSANAITKPSRVYTVTYNANSGSVSPTSATSTYTFKGYYSAASNGTQYINASGNITSDGLTAGKGYTAAKTWNAQWTGAAVTLPTPSRTGYTFGGWYKESALTNKVGDAGASYTPTANVTLYAKWTPCTYTVKFNSNKPSTATSTMSGTMSDQSFTYDVAQNLTANAFSLPGYTFAGWATSSTGSVVHADEKSVSNLTTTCGGTVNLYAKWTANTITLSWANGGRGTAPTSPASCTYDGTFTTPAAMTATGYTFNKWSVNSNTFAASTSVACTYANLGGYSGAATITGTWTANTYTIVYNANKPSAASASVSGSTASSTHTYDTAKALTSNGFSLTGWSFAGWNTQADGSGTSYSNGASVKNLSATKGATVNLYAKWTQNCIPVTLDANGGTAGSVTKIYKKADATGWYSDSACATAYTTNANLKPSRSAYTFRGFYVEPVDDISASQTTAITRYLLSDASTSTTGTNWKINAARTLYAGWAKTCVQPSNGTCKFSHGDKAVYTTTCNTGYSISGNATATPSCSIITYTIKYMDGSAEITGLTPATYNVTTATFNLPTAYKATYKFVSWHTDSALSSTAETQIAKGTTGNKVYYVKWSTCPAGSVCDGDSVVTCPAGSYCAAGSSEATPCAKGSYSTGGATTCTLADKGYYVDTTGADKQIACPAGTYGSTTGLISAACSGKCSAGRYGNATAQTAATCNGACSAGYYCPAGSISATAYDCDTGTTTASSNNYWTSDSGAGARSSCYRNVVLDKNGMSGTLALPDSSGCKSLDTSTNTLVVYYGKACKLPTTVLSGTATGTTYTGTGTWATSANAASSFVSSITVTSEAATVTYYAGKMYTCSAGYYLKANTNGACTACASPYYCTGITNKYYSSSIQGRSACSALDSTKTDGTYSSVSPYNAATTCRFKQGQQTVPTYCETKASNTMKYTSSGWEANTYSVTAKSGAIISGNNTTGATCSQCAAGTYSAGGTDTTCDAISAGCYGGAGSATACPNQCSAGTYRTSTGGKTQSDCSNVTAGCYGSAGATTACPAVCATNNYSNAGASACTPCDSDYANSGDTAESHAGVASCKVTCPAGQYVATENAACSDVGSGYYRSGTETISQGNKGTREACNALNAFYTASDSGRDAATDCFGTTTGGNYIATPKAGQVTCAAGGYCAGGSKVYYEKTGGRTACSAGTANPNTGSSASSACVTCAAGKYNTTEGNTSCLTCPANSYCTGGTNKTACNTVAGKLYTKSAEGSDAATDCYVTLASKVYLAKPTDTATTTCTAGYYCAGGDYHYSSTATNQGRSSCTGATYSGAGAASCSNCPSGYTANTSSNKTANTQCQISVDGGHYIAEAGQNSTNWGSCLAGYAKEAHTVNYGTTSECDACKNATYAANEGQASCTACPTATKYADKVKGYTYWITGGIQNSISGCRAIMKTTELQHGDLSSTSMQCFYKDGDYGDGTCQITASGLTCDGGYYLNSTSSYPGWTGYDNTVANACTSVGTGYWSAEGDRTRTACATGLTTCGSGLCANEADDCGRKLHAGDKVIHLRSAERTSPSLHVKLGDTMFYGNLVSPVDGTLKVKNGTSTYSVANDNQ